MRRPPGFPGSPRGRLQGAENLYATQLGNAWAKHFLVGWRRDFCGSGPGGGSWVPGESWSSLEKA
jgi:hypothetical protein